MFHEAGLKTVQYKYPFKFDASIKNSRVGPTHEYTKTLREKYSNYTLGTNGIYCAITVQIFLAQTILNSIKAPKMLLQLC